MSVLALKPRDPYFFQVTNGVRAVSVRRHSRYKSAQFSRKQTQAKPDEDHYGLKYPFKWCKLFISTCEDPVKTYVRLCASLKCQANEQRQRAIDSTFSQILHNDRANTTLRAHATHSQGRFDVYAAVHYFAVLDVWPPQSARQI